MKRQHVHHDVMSGVRTLGCQGKRGERENMNEEHIRLSPWPALTDLAAWLHRTRVASSRGQTETGRKRSSMASKSGDGTRDTGHGKIRGLGGLSGVLLLVKSMAFPGRSVRPGTTDGHPRHPGIQPRALPSKGSTAADQLATRQESKVSVQRFPLHVGHPSQIEVPV